MKFNIFMLGLALLLGSIDSSQAQCPTNTSCELATPLCTQFNSFDVNMCECETQEIWYSVYINGIGGINVELPPGNSFSIEFFGPFKLGEDVCKDINSRLYLREENNSHASAGFPGSDAMFYVRIYNFRMEGCSNKLEIMVDADVQCKYIELDEMGCGSFFWKENGVTYTQSGVYYSGNFQLNLTIYPVSTLSVGVSKSNISCSGGNNGSISLSASGGTPGYKYYWPGGGATSSSRSGLSSGTYNITVQDLYGCSQKVQSVTLTQPNAVNASISGVVHVSCNGGSNGQATAGANGGAPGYTYLWQGGGTSATKTGLSFGTYTVTVMDSKGCTDIAYASIEEPIAILVNTGIESPINCNKGTGAVYAGATGGSPGYSYLWSTTDVGTVAANIPAGSYTVTVTDSKGCTADADQVLDEPTTISAGITLKTAINCHAGTTGELTANGTGGTPGYSYSWSNNATTATISGLSAQTYTVTVTDANGCSDTDFHDLTSPDPLLMTIQSQTNTGCTSNTGSVSFTTSGGISPYTYSPALTGLAKGVHSFTVTDENGCTSALDVMIGSNIEYFSEAKTACQTYTWPINGQTYTASGTYNDLNPGACKDYTLNLTIIPAVNETINVTTCDEYNWTETATKYTTTGIYEGPIASIANSCTRKILNLTIINSTLSPQTVVACDSYTWPENNVTYYASTSETLIVSKPSEGNCSRKVLNLTINESPTTFDNVTECESYTWTANNTTYTTSGTYVTTVTGSTCGTIKTLYLNIIPNQDVTTTVSAVGSYFWTVKNKNYTTSGTYYSTQYNQGCSYEATLILTITTDPDPEPTKLITDCETCIGSFSPIPTRKYVVSAWVREEGASLMKTSFTDPGIRIIGNINLPSPNDTYAFPTASTSYKPTGLIIDGWQKIEAEFVIPEKAIDISIKLINDGGTCLYDDVRIYPFDAGMKSFVYDPVTARLKAVLDELNYATFYEYDQEGNLVRIKKETERGVMTIQETRSNTSQ